MARRRKPEGETLDQAITRRQLESVADFATRSEKVSWDRKMNNLVKLVTSLKPIEDEIIALMNKKQPVVDEIIELRKTMVEECIHPFDHLVHKDDHILCKFCNHQLGLPVNGDREDS